MAVFATRIIKTITYMGQTLEMGNTYHHATDLGEVFSDQANALALAAAEKAITSSAVQFVRWETWGPTDGAKVANVMRETGPLSGSGSIGTTAGMYREACLLVTWQLPRSPTTNRRRWLRKFIRMGSPSGVVSPDVYSGAVALSTAQRDQIGNSYGNVVQDLSTMGNLQLCTAEGTVPTHSCVVRPYYYTRDIGR